MDEPLEASPVDRTKTIVTHSIGTDNLANNRYHRNMVKGRDGSVWFLSDKEKLAIDLLLQSGLANYAYIARVINQQYKQRHSGHTIKRWLDKPHIQEYLKKRVSEIVDYVDMTKEAYFQRLYALASGDVRVRQTTLSFWKLIGEVKGYLGESERQGFQLNQTFQLVQSNGER